MKLVRLALPVPLARDFDYQLSLDQNVPLGARVRVPFGTSKKIGIVLACPTETDVPLTKLKKVEAVLDSQSLFDDEMWQLLHWASRYYHASLGEVLHSALPVKLRQGEPVIRNVPDYFRLSDAGKRAESLENLQKAKKQQALLAELTTFADVFEKPPACSPSAWKGLLEKGFVEKADKDTSPVPWQDALQSRPICNAHNRLTLNTQQSLVVSRVDHQQGFATFLLNGVTGSGKTEVYLHIIEQVLLKGKQVLVLVPEIGLTPQTIQRFQARFNVEIDALHSDLTDSQRLNAWIRAKNGESAIVIGTRSALFSQFHQLGLIIIDEEHDSSFKQQNGWRYHARDVAIMRAKKRNIPIVLGSATPSLESVQNVRAGKFVSLRLDNRAANAQHAAQQLIDLKTQPIHAGLSSQLLAQMQQHLACGNQVMLFLNRRGFAPVLLCHECGWISQCDACEKPFTFHQKQRILRCHHCGTQKIVPRQCGHCGSTNLITTGAGTEQLEQFLATRFPEYQISRIDRDSTARKGALEQHLQDIHSGRSQILIGTQMLAKGHHFPNVTLVALINVDSGLFSSDFRAEERLAQLYIQVAGRSGRAEKQGEVVLQTHYPDHPLLKTLLAEGYMAFAEQALHLRQLMSLPPFSSQVLFRASGRDNEKVADFLRKLTAYLQEMIDSNQWQGFQMSGALPAPMAKKAGHFRWQLIVQHSARGAIQQLLNLFDQQKSHWLRHDIRLLVDIDPQDFD